MSEKVLSVYYFTHIRKITIYNNNINNNPHPQKCQESGYNIDIDKWHVPKYVNPYCSLTTISHCYTTTCTQGHLTGYFNEYGHVFSLFKFLWNIVKTHLFYGLKSYLKGIYNTERHV